MISYSYTNKHTRQQHVGFALAHGSTAFVLAFRKAKIGSAVHRPLHRRSSVAAQVASAPEEAHGEGALHNAELQPSTADPSQVITDCFAQPRPPAQITPEVKGGTPAFSASLVVPSGNGNGVEVAEHEQVFSSTVCGTCAIQEVALEANEDGASTADELEAPTADELGALSADEAVALAIAEVQAESVAEQILYNSRATVPSICKHLMMATVLALSLQAAPSHNLIADQPMTTLPMPMIGVASNLRQPSTKTVVSSTNSVVLNR
jgi:hypothetical protein